MITRRSAALGASAVALLAGRRVAAELRSLEVWSLEAPSDATVVGRALAHVVRTFEATHPGVELKITSMPWQQPAPPCCAPPVPGGAGCRDVLLA